ncbi:MAG: alpha/beta fold hydrolase [Deinococcales bacterium]|nr:alpha/beta fold hydrolase [Deinococcales bacterium]
MLSSLDGRDRNSHQNSETLAWLDRSLYPFERRTFELDGHRLSYVDEGAGSPVLFVHGTPTWSFLWREQLRALAGEHRVLALDNLGFGLSDKPPHADYTPAAHARRLEAFVAHLGLTDLTLVVHDYGGPIGLSYALRHPRDVPRLLITNTWMWSNAGDRRVESAGRLFGGPFGRLLYTRLNLSPRVLLPNVFADRSKLTPQLHRHYLAPFATPDERVAPWVLARELLASNDWYASLWEQRGALAHARTTLLWGMKDPLMPAAYLARWREALPHARVIEAHDSSHFTPEEAAGTVTEAIRGLFE